MKLLHTKTIFIFLFAVCATTLIHAQQISNNDLKAQLIKDWNRAKTFTLAYLSTMPADKYSLKPTDSIRSFAQQMLHLAQANGGLGGNGLSQQYAPFNRHDLEQTSSAQTKDSVTYFVTTSYDFVINGITQMDASKLGENVTAFNFTMSRYVWLLKAFEHQTHHRGQATIYIRLAGVKPPNEMLF